MDTFGKQTLRNWVKEILQTLPEEYKQHASHSICQHLKQFLLSLTTLPTALLGFIPFRDEPDLTPFYGEIRRLFPHMHIGFPRMEGSHLAFHQWSSSPVPGMGKGGTYGWEYGPFGTIQPSPSLPQLGKEIPWGESPIVLVPGRVFDRHGGRIGRGKGYYDRFLRSLRQSRTDGKTNIDVLAVGICFSVQVIEGVPRTEQDEPIDHLITEEGVI
ncbi:MAG: 5-formyltetrahydrofolate cyclo-ligase [Spirochaetes bacterium]|nr:5-formyltetrahydrofolate cyclo-ligase [Spirochaetota bacterium]